MADVGRPMKYKSVKAMQNDIDNYFKECDASGRPYTVSGLAYALGTNRQTLLNYEENEEFFDTIKRAKARTTAVSTKKARLFFITKAPFR